MGVVKEMPKNGNTSIRLLVRPLITTLAKKNESPTKKSKLAKVSFNNKRCFKYQGFGHFAFESRNAGVLTFVEEETLDEEEADKEECLKNEDIEEFIQADEGESLIIRRVLNASPVRKDEWLRKNIFHNRCSSHEKIYDVIIDRGSS